MNDDFRQHAFDYTQEQTEAATNQDAAVEKVAASFSSLPQIIRYFAPYAETNRSFISAATVWEIHVNGSVARFDFSFLDQPQAIIMKQFFVNRIHKDTATASYYYTAWKASRDAQYQLLSSACQSPNQALDYLRTTFRSAAAEARNIGYFAAGKSLLHFFCDSKIAGFDEHFAPIIRGVSSPFTKSNHSSVRDLSAIISFEEVRWLGLFGQVNRFYKWIATAVMPQPGLVGAG